MYSLCFFSCYTALFKRNCKANLELHISEQKYSTIKFNRKNESQPRVYMLAYSFFINDCNFDFQIEAINILF